MLDSDLAVLYQVPTKSVNLAVRRNTDRFPADFMFRLNADESQSLRFQSETSNNGRGGRRYLPYAFTEQGVAMLATVLKSKRAIQVSIAIVRVFVKLRQILARHQDLARRLDEIERKFETHDAQLQAVFEAIRKLMVPAPIPAKRRIGFRVSGPEDRALTAQLLPRRQSNRSLRQVKLHSPDRVETQ